MGIVIRAAAVSDANDIGGSIDHAVIAAKKCIEKANVDINNIDLVVNTGLYRGQDVLEPAMTSMILKKLGFRDIQESDWRNFSSLDIIHGSSGFLYAIFSAGSMLKSGNKKMAIVLSSDVNTVKNQGSECPFNNCGSAVILQHVDETNRGFDRFVYQNSINSINFNIGDNGFDFSGRLGSDGDMLYDDDVLVQLEELTVNTVKKSIKAGIIDLSNIDYIITSQPSRDFGKHVSQYIGLNGKHYINTYELYGNINSSALSAGYYIADSKGLLMEQKKILFIGVDSELSVVLSIYNV